MGPAVVKAERAALYEGPNAGSRVLDEWLCGMPVQAARAADGWMEAAAAGVCGVVREEALLTDEKAAAQWPAVGKMAVRVPFADVLKEPCAQAARCAVLPRGALAHPTGGQTDDGWLPVELAGGTRGFVRGGNLMPHFAARPAMPEKQLREAIASSALSYLGCQYRSGGATPEGIDDAGLLRMSYLLNGIEVYRGAAMPQGFALHPIPRARLGMGDAVMFKGHVGLYVGEGKYIHASPREGSDGVVINSLLPDSPFYAADLAEDTEAFGSIFGNAEGYCSE